MDARAAHRIVFVPPCARTAEDEERLRAVAAAVYLDYSDEALAGIELIADGNVHFGGWHGFFLAERLLRSVARDVDPNCRA